MSDNTPTPPGTLVATINVYSSTEAGKHWAVAEGPYYVTHGTASTADRAIQLALEAMARCYGPKHGMLDL